jgi:ankyrin repeat protein
LPEHGANPNAKGYLQQTPVDLAKDVETTELLFKYGANATDSTKAFCSIGAIEDGRRAELFLTHGFNANSQTGWCHDTSPLYLAVLFNRTEVALALLNHGADPNLIGKSGEPPLAVATEIEVVPQLLAHGAKIDALDKDGNTALIKAARDGRTDVIKILLDHKANTEGKGKDGVTALAVSKNIETVDLLLSHGANVDDLLPVWFGKDTIPTDKQIALFRTVVAGDDTAVAGLSPDDLNARDPSTNGQMAENLAIAFGRDKALDWLLEHGADANAPDKDGFTPMHRVLNSLTLDSQHQIQIMRSLLAHGARIDPVAKKGWTPLLMAAGTFNQPVTEFLLSHGADPLLRTADGYTSLQLARRSSHGTSPMGLMIPEDVNQKAGTIDAINRVLMSHPRGELIQTPLAAPAVVAKLAVLKVSLKPPTISTARALRTASATVDIAGKVVGVGKLVTFKVDDSDAPIGTDGSFAFRRAVPIGDSDVKLVTTNEWGQTADATVKVIRSVPVAAAPTFPPLDPARAKAKPRPKAVALIIGIERYENAPPAEFAESDARSFYDYATNALGIPRDRIKLLTGGDARRLDVRKALLNWAKPLIVRGQTDMFVFFAGHGLATSDGKELFLLPYDGDRTLLADSGIRRREIIDIFADAEAASTTFFIDACYSGGTRTSETLIPSARPILVTAKDEQVPSNVTILAAAANDQLSSSLAPAKHGLFSYFLMKGLEGEAAGGDHTITAAKLEAYFADHIPPEAAKLGRTQTPQLIGDGGRVLSSW